MARRKQSSAGLGILILLAIAAALFLAPATMFIKAFGISPHKDPFDVALNSGTAWISSAIFWATLYFGIKALKNWNEQRHLRENADAQRSGSEAYIQRLVRGDFPRTSLLLGSDEKAYLVEENVRLYEQRSSRVGTGAGTRIGRLYLGKSESHSVSNLVEVDSGSLVITNEKICFNGQLEQRTILLKDINDIGSHTDFFSIASRKRNKKSLFQVDNPLLCQVLIRNILNGKFEKAFKEGLVSDAGELLAPPLHKAEGENS